jgi:hypothetical protein
MADYSYDVIRLQTTKASMQSALRSGQSGYCSDTLEFAHKFADGTMQYFKSQDDFQLYANQVSYENSNVPTITNLELAFNDLYSKDFVGGSGNPDFLPVVDTASPYVLKDSIIYQGTGLVGIGTTSVTEQLNLTSARIDGDIKFYLPFYDYGYKDWFDIASYTTIQGFSSFTTKKIFYKLVGKTLFCQYYLSGEANTAYVSFRLPDTAQLEGNLGACYNNDANEGESIGMIVIANTLTPDGQIKIYYSPTSEYWESSYPHTKSSSGSFQYEIA